MTRFSLAVCLCLSSLPAVAQDTFPWISGGTLQPLSTTADSFTGAITIATDATGGVTSIITSTGATIETTSQGSVSGAWNLSDDTPVNGEMLTIKADPGPLINQNRLCGANPATFAVLAVMDPDSAPYIQLAIFSGDVAPTGTDGDTLCVTLNYVME